MDNIKEQLKKIQEILLQDFEPFFIILFGSYSRNSQNSESDIDIAIYKKDVSKLDMFKEKQKLEDIVNKDIDLVNLADENMGNVFKYEILMNGIVLYCKDEYRFDLYKLDEFREFLDLNESRMDIINRVKEGGSIYGEPSNHSK